MIRFNLIIFFLLISVNLFAQRSFVELETLQKIKTEEEFNSYFFTNTDTFIISAISNNLELRKIEEIASLYGFDLKIREYIKSNKIYELTLEIKNGNETLIETFKNNKIPINKIEIEFYKNGNPEASQTERKARLTIKKDRNNTKNGNEPRILFSK